ncbi:MAG: hypothetical protein ABEJ34_04775 [Haloferacaceae archaeon]
MHQDAVYGPLPADVAMPLMAVGAVLAVVVVYDMYRRYAPPTEGGAAGGGDDG